MKRLLLLLFCLATFGISLAQPVATNGGSGLAPTYPSLAVAIAALNGVTITNPVVITLTGNETAPVGGYAITQLGGTALNPITIQGASSTITAALQTPGNQNDAIFKIIGGDWITIQNFTLTENPANLVLSPISANDMTEFGVALYPASTTDGAQNNIIQNNTIILNFNYPNSIGIFSTSASTSAHVNQDATSSAGTNSFNKFYGNFINDVAYGIYMISPPITATVFETGNDIGGLALVTGNTIQFGCATQATFTNVNRFSATLPAGITFRNCGAGNNASFNTISSLPLIYVQSSGIGGIVTTIGTAPTGITYMTNVNNNGITLTNAGTTAITGIDFGYGINTGTIVGNNNEITLNQNNTAAVSAALIGIKANYTSATNTLIGNFVTVNQNPTVTGSVTSPVTGINAAGVGTTITVNNNTITFKQALPGGTASFGSGAVTYIDVGASSGTILVNGNQLLTTGSTIRSTGTCIGVNHTSGTISVGLTINMNNMIIDRVATTGTITGTNESTAPSTVAHTITNNTISFINLAGTTAANGIQTLGGASATGTTKLINGNNISISGTNSGTCIGIQTGYSKGNMDNNSVTITCAAPTVIAYQATGTSAGAYTMTGNMLSLSSSATSPTSMIGFNVGATGPFQIYNNVFTSMNFTGITTASATISGIAVAAGNGNNIYNNDITNISVGAPTSTGSPVIRGIAITGGTLTNVYKNKIYGITTAASGNLTTVSGITISGGTTNNFYNNLIGDLTAPAAVVSTAANSAIIGINITSTVSSSTQKFYYNTVYLNASSSGANFGTSGIFHQTSTTGTTSALDLRNNVIVNNSTANGTGLTVSYRRSNTTLTNYASTSNNNDFYAPSLFSDGTNNDVLLTTYQTRVAPRDAASVTENPPFLSTVGSNANFLHINTGIGTALESGASNIAGITDDYDGNVRQGNPGYPPQVNGGGTAPDIGADEFDGTLIAVPKTLNSITYNQASTLEVPQGTNDAEILRLDFNVTGNSGTLNLNSIVVNSLNTNDADVTSVKLYRTNSTTFSTANPLGSATTFSGGNASFTSLAYDLPSGTTYIWVAYDVSSSATLLNFLDAQIQANQIDVAGTLYPGSAQSPTGSRQIKNVITIGTGISTQTYPFDAFFGYGRSASLYTATELGSTNFDISKLSWNVSTSSATVIPIKIYAKYQSGSTITADTWANMTSGASLLYDGNFTFGSTGWNTVTLTNAFPYQSANGNVLILCESNYGGAGASTYPSFYYTTVASNQHSSARTDNSPPSSNLSPNTSRPNIQIEYTLPVPKSLSSITYNQASTASVGVGSTDQEILRLDFAVTGSTGTLNLNSIVVTSNNTSDADISNVKLFRTTTSTFSTANQLSSTQTFSGGSVTFSSLSYDLPTGITYVWVAYDISGSATNNNKADAKITANSIDVASTLYPASEQSPAGDRTIRSPLSGDYTVGSAKFNEITGKNIYFEKTVKKVMREVAVAVPLVESKKQGSITQTPNSVESILQKSKTQIVEVEDVTWIPMENGQIYTGQLSASRIDNPEFKFPDGIEGVYATLTAAVADLNLLGVSGWISFSLTDATYSGSETFPIVINQVSGASAINTVTIKPSAGNAAVINGSSAVAILKLNGADYIIIDGLNTGGSSLQIENTNTGTSSAVIWLASTTAPNGATNNTIQNCTLKGNAPTTTFGCIVSSGSVIGNAAEAQNNNNVFTKNAILKTSYGIAAVGPTGNETGLIISNNTLGSTTAGDKIGFNGIAVFQQANAVVSGNIILGVVTATSSTTSGIRVSGTANGININSNKINDIKNTNTTGWGSNGIQLNSSSESANVTVSNNFISDVASYGYSGGGVGDNGYGIILVTGGGYNIYHNSVNLNTNQSALTGLPSVINITSGITAANSVDIRNNLFINTQTYGTERYAIYSGASNTVYANIDYNNYVTSGANLGYLTSNRLDLAAWKTATGKDISSTTTLVTFLGAPDLHLAGASVGDINLLGADLTSIVSNDIDGDTRLTPPAGPYMGADEGNVPLPIELNLFTVKAKDRNVVLNWQTKTEVNSALFNIERMIENTNVWLNVGMVQAAGNSNSPIDYSFTDSKLQSGKYSYRLRMVDADGRYQYSSVVEVEIELPKEYAISQNYPNPFNPSTRIDYQLPFDSKVTLELYGITGEKVATVINTELSAGYYTADINAGALNLASGMYIYRIVAVGANNQNFTQVKKLMLTK